MSADRLFDCVLDDVVCIYSSWKILNQLCRLKRDRELLNSYAPVFFGNVQRMLGEDVILALCRLTDPSDGDRNLSLETVIDAVGRESGFKYRRWADSALTRMRAACSSLRKYRNKHLAHADTTHRTVEGIPPVARVHVTAAIHEMNTLVDRIRRAIGRDAIYPDVMMRGDGEVLVGHLRWLDGIKAEAFRSRGEFLVRVMSCRNGRRPRDSRKE